MAELRDLVEQERQRFGVPGCAVVVVHEGQVVLQEGFGHRDVSTGAEVTPDTLFPIGSSTKTFTAAICAIAAEKARVGWDEPVAPHFPGFALKDPVATQHITLRDMLSHRSGLPRHDLLWYSRPEGSMSRAELVSVLRHLEPTAGFRERWQYNNLLYAAAGELAGLLLGTTYEQAVRTHLLDPLGMVRTGFRVAELAQDPDAATGYVVAVGSAEPVTVPYASLDLIGPAGCLNSSVAEMTAWLLELVGQPQKEPVLSGHVLDLLRTPVIPLGDVSPLTIGRSVGYAAGVAVDDYRGHRVYHHGGNIDGFSSQVLALPETGTGVVVLANRSSTALRDALPYVLLDRLLGLDPRPHGATAWEKEETLRAAMPGATSMITARADLPASRPLSEYAGRYRHPGYGELDVTEGDGTLTLRYGIVEGQLQHRHLDVFELYARLGGEDRYLPVQLHHGLTGDLVALTLVTDPTAPSVRFERVPEELDREVVAAFLGDYAMGPVTLTVVLDGEDLTVQVDAMPAMRVQPLGGLRFSARGIVVELRPPDTISTPFGDFTRVSSE